MTTPTDDEAAGLHPTWTRRRWLDALERSYRAAWGSPTPVLGVLEPGTVQAFPGAYAPHARLAGVVPVDGRRPRAWARGRGVPLAPWSAAATPHDDLVRHQALLRSVEGLILETARRTAAWFGEVPDQVVWIANPIAPPVQVSLGSWLDNAGWSTDTVLDVDEDALDPAWDAAEIPPLWRTYVRYALQWEDAAAKELEVPSTFSPPSATIGRPFRELANPFLPLLAVWRTGLTFDAYFERGTPTYVYVPVARDA